VRNCETLRFASVYVGFAATGKCYQVSSVGLSAYATYIYLAEDERGGEKGFSGYRRSNAGSP
jgi:hypothetical protein